MQFQCSKCHHEFAVFDLRLFLTRRFEGKDPVPTTIAYYVKCPKCGEKPWSVPIGE